MSKKMLRLLFSSMLLPTCVSAEPLSSNMGVSFKIEPDVSNVTCTVVKTPTYDYGEIKNSDPKLMVSGIEIHCDRKGIPLKITFDKPATSDYTVFEDSDKYTLTADVGADAITNIGGSALGVDGTGARKFSQTSSSMFKDGYYRIGGASDALSTIDVISNDTVMRIPVFATLSVDPSKYKMGVKKQLTLGMTITYGA